MSDVVLALDELREVDRPLTSSNEWVVDETKTANGCVMVQIDPHVPWTPDLRMYEVHLKGGDFNAIGATTFGSPFVIIGHNDIFACAITANAPDLADVYIETLNDTNTRYLFDGQWYDLTVEPTTIKILNSSPVTITRIYTHFGERVVVKVNWKDHIAYSARLVSMPVVRAFEQSFKLNTARDLVEFKQALAMCLIPSRNIAYGDIYGNIYYCYNARQPLKSPFYDWTRPVDGSTSDTEWGELMEFEDLPQIENPPSDYLINCNVPPWLVTEDSGIDPDDYPPYLFHKAPDGSGGITNTFRQIRAKDLIADDSSLTFEELRNTAFDSYLITAERAKLLIEVSVNDSIARFLVDDSLGLIDPAYQVLDAWDNFADKDGTGTALFSVCYELEPAWLPVDTIIDPNELTLQHRVAILKVLVEGATSLYDLHGRLDVTWADVHKISRGVDAFSVGGSNRWEQSLRSASTDHLLDGIGYCEEGSAYMMLVSLSQPVQAVSAKPHGQSEDPSSPHFSDLTELYSQDQFKPAWFLLDDILNNLESTTVLTYDGDKYGVRAECDQEHLPVSAQVCRAKVHCSSE